MGYPIPEVEGIIKKITIFPPTYPIKIIMIHRLMMDDDIKRKPITIMNAKTDELKLLRDISITLASMYISKDNRRKYIATYFKITEANVAEIVNNIISKHHIELKQYQDKLKDSHSICFGWDVVNDCEIDLARLQELKKEHNLSLN
ncbi:MAG: hypothetical protein U9N59_10915, partial [Campylobacterota bacterium]|nr:hypothetical protein [Campylobacterota bacterium]